MRNIYWYKKKHNTYFVGKKVLFFALHSTNMLNPNMKIIFQGKLSRIQVCFSKLQQFVSDIQHEKLQVNCNISLI